MLLNILVSNACTIHITYALYTTLCRTWVKCQVMHIFCCDFSHHWDKIIKICSKPPIWICSTLAACLVASQKDAIERPRRRHQRCVIHLVLNRNNNNGTGWGTGELLSTSMEFLSAFTLQSPSDVLDFDLIFL